MSKQKLISAGWKNRSTIIGVNLLHPESLGQSNWCDGDVIVINFMNTGDRAGGIHTSSLSTPTRKKREA
jgi:hypothetical protein